MTKHLIYRASTFSFPLSPIAFFGKHRLSQYATRDAGRLQATPLPLAVVPHLSASRFPFALTFKCCFVFIATPHNAPQRP